jgi:hypothetical protein
MSAQEAMKAARAVGIELGTKGDKLLLAAATEPPSAVLVLLSRHKPDIVEMLRAEWYDIVRYMNDHFHSSPPGQCGHCGKAGRQQDPFVALFVGEDWADIHSSCHPEWMAEQEAKARSALGIESHNERRIFND